MCYSFDKKKKHATELVNPREIQRKLLFALLIGSIANVP